MVALLITALLPAPAVHQGFYTAPYDSRQYTPHFTYDKTKIGRDGASYPSDPLVRGGGQDHFIYESKEHSRSREPQLI